MSDLHPLFKLERPWSGNENQIWIASTISLYRNLNNFHFPGKLDSIKKKQILSLVKQELFKLKILKNPSFYKSEELTSREKEYLVEHFLSTHNYQLAHSSEGFVIDETGEFLSTININNHLQLELIDCQGQLERGWNHLVKIESTLSQSLSYAFDSRFGFLTSDSKHCGTGFLLAAFLQPTALIHTKKIYDVLNKLLKEGVTATAITGSPQDFIGDVVVFRNQYTLGLTEENIISSLRLFLTKFLVEEQGARSRLRNHPDPEVMDLVARSYALLTHSYQLEEVEAMNAISLIKLGVELEWITGVSVSALNLLFFNTRRAHLLSQFDQEVKPEEVNHKRAEYIHKVIKPAVLAL